MPDIYRRLRKYLPLLLGVAIALLILGKPVFAHAWDPFGLTSIAFDAILDATLGILVTINSLLAQLLNASGEGLKMVLTLNPTANMPVIGDAWRIIRDMCNLIFVVAFIGIAFGTIFNATKWLPTGWHYSSALGPLLIAAILMNFSLAIGKTLVLVSNEAAKAVLDVMHDPGGMLVRNLKPNDLAIGGIDLKARAALNAPIANTLQTLTDVETATFQKCLTETRVIHADEGIFWSAIRAMSNNSLYNDQTIQKTQGECLLEIHDARYGTTPAAVAQIGQQPTIPKGTMEQKILYIGNAIFGSLMILLFVSCLLSAAIFLGLRIIMIWVLLATAALAWASYAVPGKKEFFHSWWKHFVAWNVFGPLYLLSLIPGILMLGASGQMTAQLLGLGATISSGNLLIQQFFFYVFAVVIFVGGLALSLKSSFSVVSTIKETPILGSFFAAKLGVFEPIGAGSKWTGMNTRYEGAKAGLQSVYNARVTQPLARREETLKARYQAQFGDKRALEALEQKRITEQFNKNKEAGLSIADLKSDLGNVGSPKYFAAAKALLDANELDPKQMSTYVAAASRVSPSFGRSVKEASEKKIQERSREKKFKTGAEAVAALDMFAPAPGDSPTVAADKVKSRDGILKGLERNQPLVASELVGQGLYPGKTAEQIVEANFSAMQPQDIRSLLDKARAGTITRTPDMDRLIAGRSRKLADHLNLVADATPQQQAEIQSILLAAHITPRP